MSVRPLLIAAAAVLTAVAASTAGPGPTGATTSKGAPEPAAQEPALVPRPLVVDRPAAADPFVLRGPVSVQAAPGAREVGRRFAHELHEASGFPVRVVPRDPDADITIDVDPDAEYTVDGKAPAAESYVLDVTEDGVEIAARTAHGAFNGVQTLGQLLPAWVESSRPVTTRWEVPAVHIEDEPRFAYRGVMLDVARSFQEVDTVKRYIDTLARLKMSVLHLHLADDQGWRIQITNKGKAPGDPIDYRRLTERSGITSRLPAYNDELGLTGYYTQRDYREIVEYARERFVTVVPEVDVPSHTNAALHALPELNTDRSLPAPDPQTGVVDWNGTGDVGYSALDERHPATYHFVRHVFGQLAEMTGGPYVHVGGDESHDMGHERYVDFVSKAVPEVRKATGVGTIGWTEYAEAGLNEGPGYWDGSVVQYWVGEGDWVRDFIDKGGKAIVSDAEGSYIDQKYDPSTPIGLDWACSGDCDFPRYYRWDPTTTVEGGVPEKGVLGVEAPLWSETVRGEDQAFYLTMPRAAAVLETGWTAADRKDVDGFAARLAGLGTHLTVAGTNFYESRRARWAATVAGTDVRAHRGDSEHAVGLVAAPGTKPSADGAGLVVDRGTEDGDPASDSVLTEPLTAVLECGSERLPVRFVQERPRDALHGSGVYTATVRHRFRSETVCTLVPSAGDPVPVRVEISGRGDGGERTTHRRPRLEVNRGDRDVAERTWVAFELRGFAPSEYVEIAFGAERAYTVRTDEHGRFDRHALIPRGLSAGEHVVTASQGERSADDDIRVRPGAGR